MKKIKRTSPVAAFPFCFLRKEMKYFKKVKIAVVEDDVIQSDLLKQYIERYSSENQVEYSLSRFERVDAFLLNGENGFDVVFMDIELPDGNGMEVVRKMREYDKTTLVIFVTNLAQYAVKGYEVRAFDFIVKPVSYYNFSLKFMSALENLETNRDIEVWIKNKTVKMKLFAAQITYIDVFQHDLTYHTADGNKYTVSGSITEASNKLQNSSFSFCNRCYLVNLRYVTQVTQTQVMVDGQWLQISRNKRAQFIKDLNDYLAGGN